MNISSQQKSRHKIDLSMSRCAWQGLLGLGCVALLAPGAIAETTDVCLADTAAFAFAPSGEVAQSTTSAYPQIVWQLPENQAENLQIRVTDTDAAELYFWDYPLQHNETAQTPNLGLMTMQLPRTVAAKPLAAGETQNWEITLVCDWGDRRQDVTITQQVTRVPIDETLQSAIATAEPLEAVSLYQANGFSHDALSLFLDWAADQPPESVNIIQTEWLDLQQKMGTIKQ
ncbi:MAG: DUF928 domain-containing protein [Limnothrix sp.]